ncbi:MAG: sigma-54 dependent transcriptional regulator, partial [Gemmatimonadota bacterium]|nr:sigma-54 dependent transcriptional regulator [Gemmatimonadota bacterium]
MSGIVLLVDDDPAILRAVGAYLTKSGYEVLQAATGEQALATHQRQPVDVVLLDLNLPGLAGFEVLDRLKKNGASVVVMTGQSDIPTAVAAMKRGAENFLTKPVDMDHLSVVVGRVCDAVKMRRDTELLMSRANPDVDVRSLGSSPVMLEVVKQIELLAKSDDTTGLIIGDSGTGKGYIARMIHALSARSAGPFVEVNCGNLHADYLDEELFGVERSAQPGIRDQKPGLFELADGGTVVLDAIGNLDERLQPKLLSVLESKTFRRVGGAKSVNVDVRVTAVSSTELISAVEEGDFRDDLYYRLNVLPIRLPAVRQRTREDRRALLEQLLIQTWNGAK